MKINNIGSVKMSYAKLLDKLIVASKMQIKDIAEECTKLGQKVSPAYISMLRNEDNERKTSVELSEALEKVLGVERHLLVVEAYLTNAPEEIIIALNKLVDITKQSAYLMFGERITDEQKEILDNEFKNLSLSELVIEMTKYKQSEMSNNINNINTIETTKQNFNKKVEDNSMYPVLSQGNNAIIYLQDTFKDNDIVFLKYRDKTMFRKVFKEDEDNFLLIPFNSDFETEKVKVNDVSILGILVSVNIKV